jgi:hypothetical protein
MALRKTGSFKAMTPDGKVLTVLIFDDIQETRLLDGTVETSKGCGELRTTDGQYVNMDPDDGSFSLADGTPLTTNDPNAPKLEKR